jgi:membrane protease YdiL (CAAX protease family)
MLVLALVIASAAGRMPSTSAFGVYSGLPPLPIWTTFLLVLVFNGFGEETGWRGFALAPLQERFGALTGTFVLALIWAGWHVPSFWIVEGYRSLGPGGLIGGFGLGICAGAIVLSRVANRTGGSVLAASLWHALYNMTSATAASRGIIGAVTTTCVMVWAVVLLIAELRRRQAPSLLAVK